VRRRVRAHVAHSAARRVLTAVGSGGCSLSECVCVLAWLRVALCSRLSQEESLATLTDAERSSSAGGSAAAGSGVRGGGGGREGGGAGANGQQAPSPAQQQQQQQRGVALSRQSMPAMRALQRIPKDGPAAAAAVAAVAAAAAERGVSAGRGAGGVQGAAGGSSSARTAGHAASGGSSSSSSGLSSSAGTVGVMRSVSSSAVPTQPASPPAAAGAGAGADAAGGADAAPQHDPQRAGAVSPLLPPAAGTAGSGGGAADDDAALAASHASGDEAEVEGGWDEGFDAEEPDFMHRLCPTYASDINSPLRCVLAAVRRLRRGARVCVCVCVCACACVCVLVDGRWVVCFAAADRAHATNNADTQLPVPPPHRHRRNADVSCRHVRSRVYFTSEVRFACVSTHVRVSTCMSAHVCMRAQAAISSGC
jgi:hypothetical protein